MQWKSFNTNEIGDPQDQNRFLEYISTMRSVSSVVIHSQKKDCLVIPDGVIQFIRFDNEREKIDFYSSPYEDPVTEISINGLEYLAEVGGNFTFSKKFGHPLNDILTIMIVP